MNRLIMTTATAQEIAAALPTDGQEHAVFCLLRAGEGRRGTRLLVADVLHPPTDGLNSQGEDHLTPSPQWVSAVTGRAIEERSGLLFVHSHPQSEHPPSLSPIDHESFARLAHTITSVVDGPVAAAVVHPIGWGGVVWIDGAPEDIDRVWAVGRTLKPLHPLRPPSDPLAMDDRQQDALGTAHSVLRSLSVAIVGVSGNGSPIAEQMVRAGVAETILVDDDVLDSPSNARRVLGSTVTDVRAATPPSKVDVVGRHLESLGFDTNIIPVRRDVRTQDAYRHLLDCDIVVCATDTHSSRTTVNALPYSYLLPVIDVGVRVASRAGQLAGLWSEVRILAPNQPCLWCLSVLDPDHIRAENLPPTEQEQQRAEGYLPASVGQPAPSVIPLNFVAAGMAGCAILSLLSGEGELAPTSYRLDALMGDAFNALDRSPDRHCSCNADLARGDAAAPAFIA